MQLLIMLITREEAGARQREKENAYDMPLDRNSVHAQVTVALIPSLSKDCS